MFSNYLFNKVLNNFYIYISLSNFQKKNRSNNVSFIQLIIEQIKNHSSLEIKKYYSLYFIPRKCLISIKLLEEEGIIDKSRKL